MLTNEIRPLSLTQGAFLSSRFVRSGDKLQVFGRHFAVATRRELVLNALTFSEIMKSRALNGGDVNKGIGSSTLGLDESKALGVVEPLYSSGSQDIGLSYRFNARWASCHSARQSSRQVWGKVR